MILILIYTGVRIGELLELNNGSKSHKVRPRVGFEEYLLQTVSYHSFKDGMTTRKQTLFSALRIWNRSNTEIITIATGNR